MNKQDKTILIFSPAFAASEADTIWLPWLQIFVKALNKNFPRLNVIVFAFQYPHTTKTYQWHNNTVIPFNGLHKKKAGRLLMWLKILYSVKKIKRAHNLAGIFSLWCTECTFVAKYAAVFFRLKYLCWIIGQEAREENNYVRRISPGAGSLVAMSDFLADEFYKNYKIRPGHIVPNGIDTSLFHAPVHKDIDIIGVGSLSALKQYDIFVEIVAALKKNMPAIHVVLCGDGEERERIKMMIEELSLGENITLTGTLHYAKALEMIQRAKILLHPSSYEGFSSVCLEALYAGAHVISFIQPMHHDIKHWHIVKTTGEMLAKASGLLASADTNYEPVLAYSMDDSAKAIMNLFSYGPEPTDDNKLTAFSKTNAGV